MVKKSDNGLRQPMDLAQARVPLGQVYVIPERCKECGYCVAYCPEQVLSFTQQINAKGYHYPEVAKGKGGACVHCGFCDLICPEMAIYTLEIKRDTFPVANQPSNSEGSKDDDGSS
jgi:2-oxoglutarate ferredoxin oxidoreductase subunit delta